MPPRYLPAVESGDGWVVASNGSRFWGIFGAAGLCLITADGEVLMQHRSAATNQGGTWGFPGGAVDAGESAVDAALRETFEETSVAPDLVRVLGELVTFQAAVDYGLCRASVPPEDLPLFSHVADLVGNARELGAALERQPVVHPDSGFQGRTNMHGELLWEFRDSRIQSWSYTTVIGWIDQAVPLELTWESDELRWVPLDEVEQLPLLPALRTSWPEIREQVLLALPRNG